MPQHGYLREYDEDWERGDDRDRDWREASERNRSFMFGRRDRDARDFGSSQDQHYLSWRDKQMQALDRDYEDYCRERERQFHQDFDSWRASRQAQFGLQHPGQPTDQRTVSSEPPLELENPIGSGPGAMDDATFEPTGGRGR